MKIQCEDCKKEAHFYDKEMRFLSDFSRWVCKKCHIIGLENFCYGKSKNQNEI